MINVILIFPIVACILMALIKKRAFDCAMVNVYALLHIVSTTLLALNIGRENNIPYFTVDNTNLIFLIILSLVFFMVAIYNTGYTKTLDYPDKKIGHYSFMIMVFVLAMTGTILSSNLGMAWIFVEATTLSSAYLIYFNKTKHSIEAAWKYVFICSIGIALAFVGIIFLNIAQGDINTLDFAQLY